MPVKVDPSVHERLERMDLVLWSAVHPKEPFFNEKTGKMSQRENKNWVSVTIQGPGLAREAWGAAATLRDAINGALARAGLADRAEGLDGSIRRLDIAVDALRQAIKMAIFKAGRKEGYSDGGLDDDGPF